MAKNDSQPSCCDCREVRKSFHDLVQSETSITVRRCYDVSKMLQEARNHFVGRLRATAKDHKWSEPVTDRLIDCIDKLVNFQIDNRSLVAPKTRKSKPLSVSVSARVNVSLKEKFRENMKELNNVQTHPAIPQPQVALPPPPQSQMQMVASAGAE